MTDKGLIELIIKLKAKCAISECDNCILCRHVKYGNFCSNECLWTELMEELDKPPIRIDVNRVEEIIKL